MAAEDFTPHSTLKSVMSTSDLPTWWPEDESFRIAAYEKYDQFYWNDPTQYKIRVLEGEAAIYIPSGRRIVDTTAHYYLKGLEITVPTPEKNAILVQAVKDFIKRERFMSRFHTAKHSGVARGDYAMHLTADPDKEEGTRISLTDLDPGRVLPVYDEDDKEKLIALFIVDEVKGSELASSRVDPDKTYIRRLKYWYVWANEDERTGKKVVWRHQGVFEVGDQDNNKWWTEGAVQVEEELPEEALHPDIPTIPVYWFKNMDWQGQVYGSSELRGLESMAQAVSQGATDTEMALALEGLGVYATDGGRPVDDDGVESDWEVSPGKVMEVPQGSYFRRVEGVGTITPMQEQIKYIEQRMEQATALTDVALGLVDVQTAQSGISLAIKFQPTLAKIEMRDTAGLELLTQMWFDWKIWHRIYEGSAFEADIEPKIGDKLPQNRTERVNELNNMLDRKVISRAYYRQEMEVLGYIFPEDIEAQIQGEVEVDAERAALSAPPELQPNAAAAAAGDKPPPANGGVAQGSQTPKGQGANKSNNKKRTNESSGTESGQTLRRQARG